MTNWSEGLTSDTFEAPLGTFAGFEEREDCRACQCLVRYFKTDPKCHPFRPSCSLIFSRAGFNERFWIEPVSFATKPPHFAYSVFNITRLYFVVEGSTRDYAKNLMVILS
jgi:hypothetical protein